MRSTPATCCGCARSRPLDEAIDAIDYGSIVHDGMHRFLEASGARWTADAPARLEAALLAALDARGLRPALLAWWRPRLRRIAAWVAATEIERRARAPPAPHRRRGAGALALPGPAGPFELVAPCRPDRAARRRAARHRRLQDRAAAEARGRPPGPRAAIDAGGGDGGRRRVRRRVRRARWRNSRIGA